MISSETLFLGNLLDIFIGIIFGFTLSYYIILISWFFGIYISSVIFHIIIPKG